jgi:hypothetical protein
LTQTAENWSADQDAATGNYDTENLDDTAGNLPDQGEENTGGFWDRVKGWISDSNLSKPKPRYQELTAQDTLSEMAIKADMTVGELVSILSNVNKDDEEVINSFQEDTEHPAGVAIRNAWITFFYTVPPLAAIIVGVAVAVNFGAGWSPEGVGVFLMCVVFEAIPVLLMFATAKLIGSVMAGAKKAIGGAIFVGTFFTILALGSAAAQWTLLHIDTSKMGQAGAQLVIIGGIIRTLALPLAEIAGAIALPILRSKSLDEHLGVIKKKNDAKNAINTQRIKNKLDTINAAMHVKSDLQKEDDYQKKLALANKLIDIVTEQIIKTAEDSMKSDQSKNDRGYGRR